MLIEILELAEADLIDGYNFYNAQAPELGQYFLNTLFSDIDSLILFAGIQAPGNTAARRARTLSEIPGD